MADLFISDDISSLLNTLLHNSSQPSTSSSSLHLLPHHLQQPPENRRQFLENFSFTGAFYSSGGIGDFDCLSEDQEEARVNPAPARGSSKRSRAAEVHNQSEKKRRQRINEKLKALQKLIPNSNKADKASMLDEAIEYLKQLQLQVQMLTISNGSSLHPFCIPGVAQQVRSPQVAPLLDEANSSRGIGSFPANEEASVQTMLDLSSKPAPNDYKFLMTRLSENCNSGPFGLEPSTNAHYRSFNESMPSKVLFKNSALPQLHLDMSQCGQSSLPGVSS